MICCCIIPQRFKDHSLETVHDPALTRSGIALQRIRVCKHTISFLMRLTQFSLFLSALAFQSSILSNINGQHGCSNTVHLSPLCSPKPPRNCSKFSLWKAPTSQLLLFHWRYYETFGKYDSFITGAQIGLMPSEPTCKFLWYAVCF